MRVMLDNTFARRGPGGTAVYLQALTEALTRAGIEVLTAANTRRAEPAGGGLASLRNLASDRFWAEVELPRRARRARADVIHHPLPARAHLAGVAQVVTVHDLAFVTHPELFDSRFALYARRAHRSAVRAADAVICVSRATASEVSARWGIAERTIVVAPHGPGQACEPRAGREPAAHFLYVGDDEPRKNLDLLLDAHRRYRERRRGEGRPWLPLVLAGSARRVGPDVRVEALPDARRLCELYATAAALVHPALEEGFGLTVLEAMAAGTPVIAVANAAVVELAADAAHYVDAGDADGLARTLAVLDADPDARSKLRRLGLERAGLFSWERSARRHIEAYTLALG